ncbi:uncharacterized protein ASPGLDRAFT_50251 [Aspergillus glaucus CBS 516.65]|uniref:Major facilitator superfamily (MFS) profile domain-containing protein n=1 Tax=Aspergillus glaucus CBS 516.65 TaxID=1160497 RepID=A0A1L9VCU9_ASPGL|nr:hypothetical protein ASPGLDRAFT_50251 [Aspergillus glaucus CBS 516.65]OJJ81705.1 hypothetical protein ASPGLDRAFT_50251 [Aspergillus glaucus CBS 516.65]
MTKKAANRKPQPAIPISVRDEDVEHQFEDEDSEARHSRRLAKRQNAGWRPGVREWLVLICVSIVVMMDAFDATVVIPLVPYLSHAFARPLENILWLPTGYLLANAGGQMIFAMLSEIFNNGSLMIVALLFATAGTGVCGGAMGFPDLLAGRTVQGIGGGGVMAISLLVVMDTMPGSHWARYIGWLSTVRVVGAILGPLLGGLFVDYVRFNWAFYFNFAFCALGLLICPFAVDLGSKKGARLSKFKKMDWPGCVLALTGVGFFLAGMCWGGTEYYWKDWETVMPITVGGGMIIALVFWETLWATRPLFTLRALGLQDPRSTAIAYISSFLHGFLIFCQLQYFVLYMTSVKYFSRSLAGIVSVVLTGQTLITIVLVCQAGILRKLQSHWTIRIGWAITLTSTGCFIILHKRTPMPGVIFMFFAAGTGHGFLISGYNAFFTEKGLQRQQEENRESDVSTTSLPILMYPLLRTWGMCVAVPVIGTILLGQLIRQMKKNGLDTSNEFYIRLNEILLSEGGRDELEILDGVGFRLVWEVVTALAGVGGVLSVFIKESA